jgi:hypothetical protein
MPNNADTIQALRDWPANGAGDGLSTRYVSLLMNVAADKLAAVEAENARLRTACEQYEKGAAEVRSGFPGAAVAHFEEARAALSPAAEEA